MEDIAQGAVSVSGTIAATPKFTFDFDRHLVKLVFGMALQWILNLFWIPITLNIEKRG
jgi:hypothetical protein